MYTSMFALAAALLGCIGVALYGTPAAMMVGFLAGAMAIGMAADALQATVRAAAG